MADEERPDEERPFEGKIISPDASVYEQQEIRLALAGIRHHNEEKAKMIISREEEFFDMKELGVVLRDLPEDQSRLLAMGLMNETMVLLETEKKLTEAQNILQRVRNELNRHS